MTTASLSDLADLLSRHRLLEPEQLDQLKPLLSATTEPRALAGELIRRGWLSPYQVNQLFRGRGAELLLGSYVLLEKLGEGGMGQVFKAKNWKLGRVVAVKIIRKEKLDNLDAVRRFQREIRAAAQLEHPNIVRALDADEVGGTHLLVMEHVEGTDLARLVKEKGPLPVDQAVNCVVQAARGLAHAHAAGIVHRDIKPANLLLGGKGTVKILDLGLARFDTAANALGDETDLEALTHSGNIMGTCDYMAPEQAINSKRADQRSDIYSLGCTLWFLLAGKRVYDGATPMEKLLGHRDQPIPALREVRPDVPEELEAIFRRMVAKKPEQRYPTMADVIAALEGRVTEQSLSELACATEELRRRGASAVGAADTHDEAFPSGATDGPPRRRGRLLTATGAAVLAGLLVLGIVLAVRGLPKKESLVSTPPDSQSTPSAPADAFEPEMVRTREAGSRAGTPFEVVKAPGTFLVGFAATTTRYANRWTVVGSIQPIFQSVNKSPIRSLVFGPRRGTPTVLMARDGYAVGDLFVSTGARVNSFKIVFMRIKGEVFDPTDKYESAWLGEVANSPIRLAGDGNPIVGIYGYEAESLCQLGLVQANYQARGNGKYWQAVRQVDTISQQLLECNPEFDGKVYPTIEGDAVTGLSFRSELTTDISPLKSLRHLRSLKAGSTLKGKGRLSDLGPLRGLPLRELDIDYNQVSSLEPLRHMPLESFSARELRTTDLRPLRGMPLKSLYLYEWKGSDLEPLRGLPLQRLALGSNAGLKDLGPLRGMNLDYLMVRGTGVTDLAPLKEMEVRSLECDNTCLTVENSAVLQAVKSLESFYCLVCSSEEHLAALRPLKHLRTINGLPAELFWKATDAIRVPRWQVVGPFPRGATQPFVVPIGGALPAEEFGAKYPGKGGKQVGWQSRESDNLGRVMLASQNDKLDNMSSFAYATVEAPAAGDADLWVGSDDCHILWLNGTRVHQYQSTVGRALPLPGDRVRVRLRPGVNHLLIRCDNFSKEWGFAVRVSPDR